MVPDNVATWILYIIAVPIIVYFFFSLAATAVFKAWFREKLEHEEALDIFKKGTGK